MSNLDHRMDQSSLVMVAVETTVLVAHRTGGGDSMPLAHGNVAHNSVADSLDSDEIGTEEALFFHNYNKESH